MRGEAHFSRVESLSRSWKSNESSSSSLLGVCVCRSLLPPAPFCTRCCSLASSPEAAEASRSRCACAAGEREFELVECDNEKELESETGELPPLSGRIRWLIDDTAVDVDEPDSSRAVRDECDAEAGVGGVSGAVTTASGLIVPLACEWLEVAG